MTYTIIIPARLKSSRLPNKMLLPLQNRPIIEWTWRNALKTSADMVIVATDSFEIFEHLNDLKANVVMTQNSHESGTDRLSEVAIQQNLPDETIVVNWQGDEPFLPPNLIDVVAQSLQDNPAAAISTLATPLEFWEEVHNPNIVKLVINKTQEALYFSRAPIPYIRDGMQQTGKIDNNLPFLRHIGVYGYRASFLKTYPTLPSSLLESLEKLEQLRALANGYTISVSITDNMPPPGIDTVSDLQQAELWLKNKF